jgi:hypothetical protein
VQTLKFIVVWRWKLLTDDNVGFRSCLGKSFRRVIVPFDDAHVGVALAEGFGYIAEEHCDHVLRMLGDKCIEDGATDVASPASPSPKSAAFHRQAGGG